MEGELIQLNAHRSTVVHDDLRRFLSSLPILPSCLLIQEPYLFEGSPRSIPSCRLITPVNFCFVAIYALPTRHYPSFLIQLPSLCSSPNHNSPFFVLFMSAPLTVLTSLISIPIFVFLLLPSFSISTLHCWSRWIRIASLPSGSAVMLINGRGC